VLLAIQADRPAWSARTLASLSSAAAGTVSVIISTYQRPDECERALRSVLDQTEPPLEVLICDDGSADETTERFHEWGLQDTKVRYLRLAQNTGTPASARNLGINRARGAWVAFLDDDDTWFPGKLARQREAMASTPADVIATNALCSDGSLNYENAPALLVPSRAEILRANPVITSSVLVRRSLIRFPTARWLRGIEDYAAWLELADRGARFLVLGEPLVSYENSSEARLSAARARTELAVTRLAWQRAARRPRELTSLRAAIRRTAGALHAASADAIAALRARFGRAA
jgi:teichuronic acid biosynthesis glycosyltransferase TuaG